VLIVAEICTPMFGLLALLAVVCAGGGVYLCYTIDGVVGIVATVVALVGLPAYAVAAVRILPRTALGRALFLKRDAARRGEGTPEADELSRFVGKTTTAESVLRPSGTVRIDGKRIVAQAESGMIEKGQKVKVVRATGTNVVVRRVETES